MLKCGRRKVWLDPNEVNEISMANSRKFSSRSQTTFTLLQPLFGPKTAAIEEAEGLVWVFLCTQLLATLQVTSVVYSSCLRLVVVCIFPEMAIALITLSLATQLEGGDAVILEAEVGYLTSAPLVRARQKQSGLGKAALIWRRLQHSEAGEGWLCHQKAPSHPLPCACTGSARSKSEGQAHRTR